MYVIKNKKYGNYFAKHILGIKNFTSDIQEAARFKTKKEVNTTMRIFNHKDNFEIVKVPK